MKQEKSLRVGYARVDITPEESVPLAGYGNSMKRLSQGVLDPIYATCIAVTDGTGGTLLLYTLDLISTTQFFSEAARDAVSERVGVPREQIVMSATHVHSTPEFGQREYPPIIRYKQSLTERLIEVAEAALADRKPAKMEYGRSRTEGLNFVRHYVLENGAVAGDNFGDFNAAPIRAHVSEADREIQLVKFSREGGKDILAVNWQAHPTKASTIVTAHGRAHRPYITADYVGACRRYVEEKTGLHFAYFQGACGNINSRSRIEEEDGPVEHVPYGQMLGDYILQGLADLKSLSSGRVAARAQTLVAPANHTEDHLLPHAKKIIALWEETNNPAICTAAALPYGIHSSYHAMEIKNKAGLDDVMRLNLGACCVGDLGFAALSYEMFDTNGKYIKENAPFAMTFILECANGDNDYIPSRRGFEHGCYEADSCMFMPGTGEQAADCVLDMLREMHGEA